MDQHIAHHANLLHPKWPAFKMQVPVQESILTLAKNSN
jgi:hypothetical protein